MNLGFSVIFWGKFNKSPNFWTWGSKWSNLIEHFSLGNMKTGKTYTQPQGCWFKNFYGHAIETSCSHFDWLHYPCWIPWYYGGSKRVNHRPFCWPGHSSVDTMGVASRSQGVDWQCYPMKKAQLLKILPTCSNMSSNMLQLIAILPRIYIYSGQIIICH